MRGAVVPLSVSSQLYSFAGNTSIAEAQAMMPCLDNSMPMDSSRVVNFQAEAQVASFCWDSIAFSDYLLDPVAAGSFHVTPPHQSSFLTSSSYVVPFSAGLEHASFSTCDTHISSSQPSSAPPPPPPLVTDNHNGFHSRQLSKRPNEVSSSIAMKGGKRKKPNTIIPAAETRHHQQMNAQSLELKSLQVPVRRSQKMSDKITALQKLVSPYGKTDTASVLQEASLYIKLLQKHIQILSHSCPASSPADDHSQETAAGFATTTTTTLDRELTEQLRRRGLCLVPLSLTQKIAALDQEDRIGP